MTIQIPKSIVNDYGIKANEDLSVTKHRFGNCTYIVIIDEANKEEFEKRFT